MRAQEFITETAEVSSRVEAQAAYMQGQCMILAVAINQLNSKRYPIGYIWEYNMSAGAPDMELDDDEWEYLSPQEQQEISQDISRHSVVHAYVRDQETGEYIDARGRHKTLPNLWGRLGQTRFEEFPGTARELIDITAHGDWDEVGKQVSFKRGQPAFDSLAGPAGVKRAQDYAVKYLGVAPETVTENWGIQMYAIPLPIGNYLGPDSGDFAPPGNYQDSADLHEEVFDLIDAGVEPDVVPADPKQLLATQDWLSNAGGDGPLFDEYPDRPVVYEKDGKYYILDGHHRTTKAWKTGRPISVYLFSDQSLSELDENFADGKNPGRKGLSKRVGVNTKASVSSLRKTAKNSSGEKQRMAHWLANMKAGRAKAKRNK